MRRASAAPPSATPTFAARLACLAVLAACATAHAQPPQRLANHPSEPKVVPPEHPLAPAIELARASREAIGEVKDYEAAFSKRDVVRGEVFAHTLYMKYRAEPSSVYLRFYKPHEGREVIYVEGANNGKLLAHETGIKSIVGTVALDPLSEQALSESRHPITRIGMFKLVDGVITQWEKEAEFGECEVKYYPKAKLREMECQVVEVTHPVPRRQFPFHRTRLYIDKKTNFAVRVENYGFPPAKGGEPPLIEEYTYWNVRTNVGLTDADFDPRNPNYAFN